MILCTHNLAHAICSAASDSFRIFEPLCASMCTVQSPRYVAHAVVFAPRLHQHFTYEDAQQAIQKMSDMLQIPVHVFKKVACDGCIGIVTSPERFYRRKMFGVHCSCPCCGDTPTERLTPSAKFRSTCDHCGSSSFCDRCCIEDTLVGQKVCLHCFLHVASPASSRCMSHSSKLWLLNLRKLDNYCGQRLLMSPPR